jgi:hypothetical protein
MLADVRDHLLWDENEWLRNLLLRATPVVAGMALAKSRPFSRPAFAQARDGAGRWTFSLRPRQSAGMIRHSARSIPHAIATGSTQRGKRPCARPQRVPLTCLVCAAVSLVSTSVAAQEPRAQDAAPDPSVVAAARALAIDGVKLAQDGRCRDAIDKLERAEQLFHGPIVLAQLGVCYVEVGRLVEGSEALRVVLRDPLPDNASDALKHAHASARTTLDTTKDKIAMLTISVDAPKDVRAHVTIDGKSVPDALLGAPRPTDPGEHTVEAVAPGYLVTKRKVALEAGETARLELSLVIDPKVARAKISSAQAERKTAAEVAVPRLAVAQRAHSEPTLSSPLPAYIAWGVGVAALGAGLGFGWVALHQGDKLDEACPDQLCPRAQSAKLDAARTNGVISTIGFSTALAAAVAGGVLFLLASGSDDARGSHEQSSPRASLGLGNAELTVPF